MTSMGRANRPGRMSYQRLAETPGKVCKDCIAAETVGPKPRPAPYPGPRCTTHHNAAKRNRRIAAKVRRVENTYGLSAAEYDALYAFQGGRCALCRRATGASKRLAVDHDHFAAMTHGHAPERGCKRCVRGLVCSTCNDVLAHFRDSPDTFARGAAYLVTPPWKKLQQNAAYDGHHD